MGAAIATELPAHLRTGFVLLSGILGMFRLGLDLNMARIIDLSR